MKDSEILTELLQYTHRLQGRHVREMGLYNNALAEIEDLIHRKRFDARFHERYPNGYPKQSWWSRLWAHQRPSVGHNAVAGLSSR